MRDTECERETPNVREKRQRARKTKRHECVSEKKKREKELKELGLWMCEKVEKIEIASDSDALKDRERERQEKEMERL